MTRDQREHAIRAACDISGDTELLVFGSQSILGTYPNVPEPLSASIEIDVQPKNHPENTDLVDGALGELSQFHSTHGFYVHGVSVDSAVFPEGWSDRTIGVSPVNCTEGYIGHCLEAHDLAASKLVANREKDRTFVTVLLRENLVVSDTLIKRVAELPVDSIQRESIENWVRIIAEDICDANR